MNNVYMTLFSAPSLPRALALYLSFMKQRKGAQFAFFCMADQSAAILESLDLPDSRVYRHADFADEALLSLRSRRSWNEYCWTAKPFSLCKILDTLPDVDCAVLLAADTLSFPDPDKPLHEAGAADFLFTPHLPTQPFMSFAPPAACHYSGYHA